MAITPIRKFTKDDEVELNIAASNFIARHEIQFSPIEQETIKEESLFRILELHVQDNHQLRRLWQKCFCSALKVPNCYNIAIGYGYVGYN
jgi:hypothetical protein